MSADPVFELELKQVPYGNEWKTIKYTIFDDATLHVTGTIGKAEARLNHSQLESILDYASKIGITKDTEFGDQDYSEGIIAEFSIAHEDGNQTDITLCFGYLGTAEELRKAIKLKQLAQQVSAAAALACPSLGPSLFQATAALYPTSL
jgi:hypothetical protein